MSYARQNVGHPSRTEHGTMKIRELSTGNVIERQAPDAADLVAFGGHEYVSRDEPTTPQPKPR